METIISSFIHDKIYHIIVPDLLLHECISNDTLLKEKQRNMKMFYIVIKQLVLVYHCTECKSVYSLFVCSKASFPCRRLCSFTVKLSWHLVVVKVTTSCEVLFSFTSRYFIDPSREVLLFAILQVDQRSALITEQPPWRLTDSMSCRRTNQQDAKTWTQVLWLKDESLWCPSNLAQVIFSNCM